MQRNMMGPMQRQMNRPVRSFPNMGRGTMRSQRSGLNGSRRGNLLSNLFQRQNNAQMGNRAAGFTRAETDSSLLQGLANPAKISSFLDQTQQVLNTAQKFGPMIQQYGPMVKNLPSMWKLYRGLKDSMEDSEQTESSHNEGAQPESISEFTSESSNLNTAPEKPVKRKYDGKSVPKLYIP